MQLPVFGLRAGEQEEWIDKQRQVRHERNVECTVLLDDLPTDSEVVGEVQVGRGLPALLQHGRSIAGLRRMAAVTRHDPVAFIL